eukprot:TRINITY_DN1725_c0_g2_i1.p2 TRINITY_DN1725_c0_g2~~TRINITY_DN1725_c0_g2_i1.p2  ORF type:complete len:121 (+),score=21.08 TRINITY_DN1725_c0_g2_i1:294-656(+)
MFRHLTTSSPGIFLQYTTRIPSVVSLHFAMSFSYSPSFFQHFPKYHAPHLKPGEDIVDPMEELKPKCLASCGTWLSEYNACVRRIGMRTDGKGDCNGQYLELVQCQDHCLGHELFHHVKG